MAEIKIKHQEKQNSQLKNRHLNVPHSAARRFDDVILCVLHLLSQKQTTQAVVDFILVLIFELIFLKTSYTFIVKLILNEFFY